MRITNHTDWSTADLRRVFTAVLRHWNEREEPRYHVHSQCLVDITIVSARWRSISGHAYYNSGTMRLRLNRATLNVRSVAWLFEHELAHCAGYGHKATPGRKAMMGYINHGPKTPELWMAHYGFVDGLTIGRKPAKVAKPQPDRQAVAYERTLESLKRWETKRKRALTAIRKLTVRRKYYERALAAKRPNPEKDDG